MTTQWSSLANPIFARDTFHWPFLANATLATPMIVAYGGGKWCQEMILRWASQGAGLESLRADDALAVYAGYFANESVVRASCDDYEAGSNEDVVMEREDQEVGRGIAVDTLLMFSKDYLGSRHDVPMGWKSFVMETAELKIGELTGVGHFLPEEAPEEVSEQVALFYLEVVQKIKARG
jgi:pimeloyl-ACP methyl ester carboxylesterase